MIRAAVCKHLTYAFCSWPLVKRNVGCGPGKANWTHAHYQLFLNPQEVKFNFVFPFPEHYRSVADDYEYFYKETYEAFLPYLMKSLDLKPHHVVADIGSGTGSIAKNIFESFVLKNPVWCVDPSAEMQEVARKRKGTYPVQKTAEEFFSDPKISQSFDTILAVFSTHHFADPNTVYEGIFRSLRPSGSFVQFDLVTHSHPTFKMASNSYNSYFQKVSERKEFLREIKFQGKFSQEEFSFAWYVTKSKLYEMFRRRYTSVLHQLRDEQIEEGIKELESETLKDVRDNDLINCNSAVLVTKFELD